MKSAHLRGLSAAALSLATMLAGLTPLDASAQWKWRDANGVVQYSDRPPPNGTPEQSILSRPSGMRRAAPAPEAASAPAAANPELKQAADLEARKRKAEQEEKAKADAQKKAEEERVAKTKADNCERARSYMRSLNDGIRIARVNAQGEREILDDGGRAAEQRRTQELINSNCR